MSGVSSTLIGFPSEISITLFAEKASTMHSMARQHRGRTRAVPASSRVVLARQLFVAAPDQWGRLRALLCRSPRPHLGTRTPSRSGKSSMQAKGTQAIQPRLKVGNSQVLSKRLDRPTRQVVHFLCIIVIYLPRSRPSQSQSKSFSDGRGLLRVTSALAWS